MSARTKPASSIAPLERGATSVFVCYTALFLDRGVASPFIPLWLRDHGLSAAMIATALGAPQLARLATGPLIGLFVERFRRRRDGVAWVALSAMLGFAGLAIGAGGAWMLFAAWFLAATASTALVPLIDVAALRAAARGGPHYGAYRSLGTSAYLVANLAGGAVLRLVGTAFIPIWSLLATAVVAGSARALPMDAAVAAQPSIRRAPSLADLAALARRGDFLVLLVIVGLIDASHVYFYSFSSLLWRARGLDGTTIGALWAVCALAEAAFLAFGESWRRRLGPWRLLMIGAVASALRWIGLGLDPPLWVLFLLQIAHAASFTTTFVAALGLVERQLGSRFSALGQTLCAAISNGFLVGVATLACGSFAGRLGGAGYFPMAALAALAAILALVWRGLLTCTATESPRVAVRSDDVPGPTRRR